MMPHATTERPFPLRAMSSLLLATCAWTAAAEAQDLVLRRKDASGVFDCRFTDEIARICDRLGIRYSFKDEWIDLQNRDRPKPLSLGQTELGRLVAATGGLITGTTVQIPTNRSGATATSTPPG